MWSSPPVTLGTEILRFQVQSVSLAVQGLFIYLFIFLQVISNLNCNNAFSSEVNMVS